MPTIIASAAPAPSAGPFDITAEWLEPDGLGGFASGTVGGARTRRYHALLLSASTPPTGRVVLVNGIEVWAETDCGTVALSTQHYAPDVTHPDGWRRIAEFRTIPWPTWIFALPGGARIAQEVLVARNCATTVLRWRRVTGQGPCKLSVRPLLSGRDYHSLHRENDAFDARQHSWGGNVVWRPYPGLPAISALSNGDYTAQPDWYRNFLYVAERDRGLDCLEDLCAPGVFTFDLAREPAAFLLRANDGLDVRPLAYAEELIETEHRRREGLTDALSCAADAYFVDRGRGRTLIAGYPWFTDWGRDTFIALRGLALGTGRLDEAAVILDAWSGTVSEGMLPNRFPDAGEAPEYNSVDASLWFIIAIHDFLHASAAIGRVIPPALEQRLGQTVAAILDGYTRGTRYGIGLDTDGLIRAGVPGVQLTWMDAKIGDWVVTPRIGKPVEVQALWINALRIAQRWSPRWRELELRARASFAARFRNPENGGLFDVIDADHVPGAADAKLRPNQIFAVGGLPFALLDGSAARAVTDLVEAKLLTPLGLRSLSPDDADYVAHYRGGARERDAAYHQGTVWPWLMGPFVEAWLRVRGDAFAAQEEARRRFIAPLLAHLQTAGLGHVSEIADGDAPHTPGGCPFQAWSLGELIRATAFASPQRAARFDRGERDDKHSSGESGQHSRYRRRPAA